jgi:hypothetical protein
MSEEGFVATDYDGDPDYDFPDKLPGIPILFPRKKHPELSDSVNKILEQCEGIPLVFNPNIFYKVSEKHDYSDKEKKE